MSLKEALEHAISTLRTSFVNEVSEKPELNAQAADTLQKLWLLTLQS